TGEGGIDIAVGEDQAGALPVRRRHRVDKLSRIEIDFLRRAVIEPLDLAHRALQPAGGEEIALLDIVEYRAVVPCLVLEAAVSGGGLDHRWHGFAAEHALRGALPQS